MTSDDERAIQMAIHMSLEEEAEKRKQSRPISSPPPPRAVSAHLHAAPVGPPRPIHHASNPSSHSSSSSSSSSCSSSSSSASARTISSPPPRPSPVHSHTLPTPQRQRTPVQRDAPHAPSLLPYIPPPSPAPLPPRPSPSGMDSLLHSPLSVAQWQWHAGTRPQPTPVVRPAAAVAPPPAAAARHKREERSLSHYEIGSAEGNDVDEDASDSITEPGPRTLLPPLPPRRRKRVRARIGVKDEEYVATVGVQSVVLLPPAVDENVMHRTIDKALRDLRERERVPLHPIVAPQALPLMLPGLAAPLLPLAPLPVMAPALAAPAAVGPMPYFAPPIQGHGAVWEALSQEILRSTQALRELHASMRR